MIDIHALDLLLGIETCKGAKWVVADHQCLPASHVEGALPLEGSMHSSVKDTNKSLQLIHSVLHQWCARNTNDEQEYRKHEEYTQFTHSELGAQVSSWRILETVVRTSR